MQKDFAQHATSASALREADSAQSVVSGGRRRKREHAAPPKRDLYAYFLPDGGSYALHQEIGRHGFEIDESTRLLLRVRMIGDPEESGNYFKARLSPEERARRKREANHYVRRFIDTDRESHHVIGESRRLANQLEVPLTDLPCIAFLRWPGGELKGTWRLQDVWYRGEKERVALCKTFNSWLRTGRVQEAMRRDREEQGFVWDLSAELDGLSELVDHAVGQAALDEQDLARKAQAAGPAIPPGVRLVIESATREVRLDGVEVRLRPSAHAFLLGLAETPGGWVEHESLVQPTGNLKHEGQLNIEKLVRDRKLLVMKGLRGVGAQRGMPTEEIDRLVEAKPGFYRLAMSSDEVLIR